MKKKYCLIGYLIILSSISLLYSIKSYAKPNKYNKQLFTYKKVEKSILIQNEFYDGFYDLGKMVDEDSKDYSIIDIYNDTAEYPNKKNIKINKEIYEKLIKCIQNPKEYNKEGNQNCYAESYDECLKYLQTATPETIQQLKDDFEIKPLMDNSSTDQERICFLFLNIQTNIKCINFNNFGIMSVHKDRMYEAGARMDKIAIKTKQIDPSECTEENFFSSKDFVSIIDDENYFCSPKLLFYKKDLIAILSDYSCDMTSEGPLGFRVLFLKNIGSIDVGSSFEGVESYRIIDNKLFFTQSRQDRNICVQNKNKIIPKHFFSTSKIFCNDIHPFIDGKYTDIKWRDFLEPKNGCFYDGIIEELTYIDLKTGDLVNTNQFHCG